LLRLSIQDTSVGRRDVSNDRSDLQLIWRVDFVDGQPSGQCKLKAIVEKSGETPDFFVENRKRFS
jgi:hypothetical protein